MRARPHKRVAHLVLRVDVGKVLLQHQLELILGSNLLQPLG